MYYYLYDSYLNNKKYYNTLAHIETRLTDLGINGKINRLSFLKNIYQVINEEIKRGVKTVVIVGNDKTISRVINLAADLNVILGIIPVGAENNIAQLLGIPGEEYACDVLSARIIEKMDLGKINNYYFITAIEMTGKHILLECDNNYFINLEDGSNINISNLNICNQITTNPIDGQLDIFIQSIKKGLWRKDKMSLSHFKSKKIKINSEKSLPILLIDEKRIIKTPAELQLMPKAIKIIVGRDRQF